MTRHCLFSFGLSCIHLIDILVTVPRCVVCTRALLVIFTCTIPFVGYGAYGSMINKPKVAGLNPAVVTNVANQLCVVYLDKTLYLHCRSSSSCNKASAYARLGGFTGDELVFYRIFPGGVPSRGVKASHTHKFRFHINFYDPICRKRSKDNFVIENRLRFTFC